MSTGVTTIHVHVCVLRFLNLLSWTEGFTTVKSEHILEFGFWKASVGSQLIENGEPCSKLKPLKDNDIVFFSFH